MKGLTGRLPARHLMLVALAVASGCGCSDDGFGYDGHRTDLRRAEQLDLRGPIDWSAWPGADAAPDADAATACIGVKPPADAWGRKPAPWRFPMDGGVLPDAGVPPKPQAGDALPLWALNDYQPHSCGFGATYGLDRFGGRPLIVALWAGW